MKVIKILFNPIFIGIVIILIIIGCFTSVFIYRTTYYVNYLKNCPKEPDSKRFCYIKIIDLPLPKEHIAPLLIISREEGKRNENIKKRQKAIPLRILNERYSEIVEWYKNLPQKISDIIGTQVQITPLDQPNSLSLVVYEKEGDFIDWHFDTNHYNGRYFTLLIPITTEPTCGNYQYKDHEEKVQTLELEHGQAILFEGDKVFHRGKELCKDQRRIVLSCTFTTSQDIPHHEVIINRLKNWGFYGE